MRCPLASPARVSGAATRTGAPISKRSWPSGPRSIFPFTRKPVPAGFFGPIKPSSGHTGTTPSSLMPASSLLILIPSSRAKVTVLGPVLELYIACMLNDFTKNLEYCHRFIHP
ncbi:hypothetical protein BC938DRAFT_475520 [Jimgerdemannia flammicorona]|uniref:Uncharacterized protein n=1 Tax=Jimgerdemannia flammicorona TaxID=994334 RepID=A0A433PT86_9FUNG|nr:hypothetical protein BC938DRAFT_475520 [Jimgerdemannia flammicorona]